MFDSSKSCLHVICQAQQIQGVQRSQALCWKPTEVQETDHGMDHIVLMVQLHLTQCDTGRHEIITEARNQRLLLAAQHEHVF